ncbi:hypothetical protein GCK32_014431, partial [Trichostrongylus colubriformis]
QSISIHRCAVCKKHSEFVSCLKMSAAQLMKRVLMVPPKHFTVEYNINPWMGGVVDKAKAFEQWNALKSAIEKEGVEVRKQGRPSLCPDFNCAKPFESF